MRAIRWQRGVKPTADCGYGAGGDVNAGCHPNSANILCPG
jgi:hypothetical protein